MIETLRRSAFHVSRVSVRRPTSTGEVMTYSSRSPGYPPAQQPTTQFAAPTQQFSRAPEPGPGAGAGAAEPSKLPVYLSAVVAVFGLGVYIFSFGPYFSSSGGADLFTPTPLYLGIVAGILAGLLAGVAVLPKQKAANAVVAVLSVLGFLLVIGLVITAPSGVQLDWGLYGIIAFSGLQAIAAVALLLVDAGVIAPPPPRPAYEQPQQQYGQYGAPGPYYGQPQQQPYPGGQSQPGPSPQGPPPPRPGYPSQYSGYSSGPSTGGFPPLGPQSGSPTPPTGFPAYRQPPPSSAPTTQVPTPSPQQSPSQQSSSQQSSSQQSGKSSS
jgi:hypothetical protein